MNGQAVKRQDDLNQRVQYYATKGWHVETRSDFQVTIAKGTSKLPATINLILTLLTAGLWLIYWLFAGGKARALLTVDEAGQIDERLISGTFEDEEDLLSHAPRASVPAAANDAWERTQREQSN